MSPAPDGKAAEMAQPARRNIAKLTPDELHIVRNDWSSGQYTSAEIASKHNLSLSSLNATAKKEEWGVPKIPGAKSNAGRRPIYNESFNHMAYVACSESGFTREQLATLFFVTVDSIYRWQRKYPEFKESIQRGLDDWLTHVAETNLRSNVEGIRYTETTKERVPVYEDVPDPEADGHTKRVQVGWRMQTTKTVRKYIPPNQKAIEYALNNRAPTRWKNPNKIEISGPDGDAIPVNYTVDDILAAAAENASGKTPMLPNLNQEKIE